MKSQPQNPELRINPENFHPCIYKQKEEQTVGRCKHCFQNRIIISWLSMESRSQTPEFMINPAELTSRMENSVDRYSKLIRTYIVFKQDISGLGMAMDNGLLFIFRHCWPEFFQ